MIEKLRRYSPLILILFFSLLTWFSLLKSGYFPHHDDLQIIRVYEMRKCFSDLQIPCRWVPDMGYGYGFPLFNYYAPFVYYLGGLISYGLGYVLSVKVLFIASLFVGSLAIYLLIKEIFGKVEGVVASILYTFVPYRALDVYVRGALSESWSIAIFPLVLLFLYKLIKNTNVRDCILFVITLSILLLTHNIMTLIYTPVIVIFGIIWLKENNFKKWVWISILMLISVGMSSFFLIPAFFEKSLVQVGSLTSGYYDYRNHFVSLKQLFIERSWDYGVSRGGIDDGMSFQIGWPHWWLVTVVPLLFTVKLIRKQYKSMNLLVVVVVLLVFTLWMTHNKSNFIWKIIPLFSFIQFPWRFLALSSFLTSVLGGVLVNFCKGKIKIILSVLIVLAAFIFNIGYFKPQSSYELSDESALKGSYFENQKKGAIADYLPKTAKVPLELSQNKISIILGSGLVSNFQRGSNTFEFNIDLNDKSTILIPIYNFPNWKITVDNANYKHNTDALGRILLTVDSGSYCVKGRLVNTPIRTLSNIISVFSGLLFVIILYAKDRKYCR